MNRNVADLQRALRRLERATGRIARRNARRRVLGVLRSLRLAMDRLYPPIPKTPALVAEVEHPALKAARTWKWRRFEWQYINPGRAAWNRSDAQAFSDWYAAKIGQPSKPIRFDLADHGRLGEHRADSIRLHSHQFGRSKERAAYDKRTKSGYRSVDWCKWQTLLHEIAHYRQHNHTAKFNLEIWTVFQAWKEWRSQQYLVAAKTANVE